jgi:hypothetical protein
MTFYQDNIQIAELVFLLFISGVYKMTL